MQDRYLYKIDKTIYRNVENQDAFFVVTGWCYLPGEDELSYSVKINDEIADVDYIIVPRRDIMTDNIYVKKVNVGFRIKVICNKRVEKFQLFVSNGINCKELLLMNKKRINKVINYHDIDYAIDHCSSKDNIITVNGWATSVSKDSINYRLLDNKGEEIKSSLRITNREDLYNLKIVDELSKYCGFNITFEGDLNKEKYVLELANNNDLINVKLYDTTVIKSSVLFKSYIKSVNPKKIKKAYIYLKTHGLKKFLTRIKEGPVGSGTTYKEWFELNKVTNKHIEEQKKHIFLYNPKISIVVPTYNTDKKFLEEMVYSVIEQTYPYWELCIADGSDNNGVYDYIKQIGDQRIKITRLHDNYGISGNTNKALALASGDYVGLFDHDDLLTPDCLYEVVHSLQEVKHDIIYTDEDKLDNNKKEFVDPNFKPDFNVDLFRSHNYITHFFVVKTEIIKGVGGFNSEYDGAQDYDIMFKCIEKSQSIYHIPKILYHWRMHALSTAENPESKLYCYDAGKRAIEDHYKRIGVEATVEMMGKPLWGMYHTIYSTKNNPLVSIIIPNKDHKDILETCINSLYCINTYCNFEIIIVENNSETAEIFDYYDHLKKIHDNVKIITWDGEFNYSLINNYGVDSAKGDYLLFLNNDTEVIAPNAISEMLGCCMREDVGVVGAKLLYEDDTVQHAGVVIGFGGFAGHIFTGIGKNDYGYMVRARINCDYSAVTAACMMVDRECFKLVEGFSPEFKIACNDIDLCLKIRELDKLVVYNAFALWHHYESKSRGYEDNQEKIERFDNEVKKFQERWEYILLNGDPYYNKNFKIEYGPFVLG